MLFSLPSAQKILDKVRRQRQEHAPEKLLDFFD
jgi:hypothetical protein